MNWLASDITMVRRLIVKDWQVYQKQLAGYVAGLLLALGLVGMGTPLLSAAGALILLVLLIVVGSYAIQSSVMAERKLQTQPFVMSLPVTPMDVFWAKLLANLVIYLVPFLLVVGGLLALILTTPRPDGAVPWVVLVAMFLLANFCVSLCVAIAVDSEGWNVFAMLALMTLVGPFIWWVSRLDAIARHLRTDQIVWSTPVLGVLAGELAVIVTAILAAGWVHARKPSFL
ncbi:MAG TPA: ABC-2 transporter permease [Dokdonella sp.]|uniref:ABC-2 transporter permease n=1 Tax=Dokdonella sp. TaxID=2291710 RepID=UPI0025C5A125|nr:ABC-2 transporter permease [Dokdonella sp.]MBX3693038.1 ABC-2 transporter permease [Dokdonella sp.]MCW5568517.1 ABC-2 transporter permease [Dokdonella sp.]HNR92247.1 ABC-2 transporter permease [Dokdonella sp.]